MRKILAILFFFTGCVCLQAQMTTIPKTWHDEKPSFVNQGEQEDYWSWKLFTDKYSFAKKERFTGLVSVKGNAIWFGKTSSLNCNSCNEELKQIFEKGIFYPRLLGADFIDISALEELKFLSDSPKVKRFRFWLFRPNIMNPQVYLFELQNTNPNELTTFSEFLEGANVTFVKDGWIII